MSLKNKLKEFALEKGLEYGIGSAEPFYEYKDILTKPVPFVSYTYEERLDPSLALEGAKSLIAIGLSYNFEFNKPTDKELYVRLSQGAIGRDYHLVMGELLKELCHLLFDNTTERYIYFCDTGPLSDSLVALRCGLGCRGLNNAVINDKLGAMFFIGYIITTAEIEPSPKHTNKCTGCKKCLYACPTGAISQKGFDYKRCVAYLTQYKGEIAHELKGAMGSFIYGCDICRTVCPLNPEPAEKEGCAYPEAKKLLSLSNREFKELYGDTAMGWRGKNTIIRNTLIALGNSEDKRAIELIMPFLENEVLKETALWAINKLKGEKIWDT